MTNEFKINNNIESYKDVINASFLLPQTKKEYLSFFRLYEDFIIDKNRIEIINAYNEKREPNLLNLYNPENAWQFIMDNKKLNNLTKKQRLKKFLSIMRKATGDASLIYKGNFPKNIKTKIKHLITEKELTNYTNYLKKCGLYESLLLVELLYKFGFRIGALSKLKVKNLSEDNILILVEKNSEIIKKKLMDKTAEKIRKLIEIQNLNKNDYIFFPNRFIDNENKRAKFFSYYVKKSMVGSKAFPNNDLENISAHCFRATLAVKKYKEGGAIEAQKILNHKNVSTTLSHYIKINDRGIELNEEKRYKHNKKLKTNFDFFNKNNEYDLEKSSSEESNLSDDFSYDNIDGKNKDEEEKLFTQTIPKPNVNTMFLNKKRNLIISEVIPIKEKTKENNNNFFDSILEEKYDSQYKEKSNIKNILKECGRFFVTVVESKKEQYQLSKYVKIENKSKILNQSDFEEINDTLVNNKIGIFEYAFIKKIGSKYNLSAKKNIKKNDIICEATGLLILENELKSIKFKKNDKYIQYIPFYKTKNKLRNRILLTNKISNLIIFLNSKPANDKSINTKFYLYNDNNGLSHLVLRAIKFIKKGELLFTSEEEIKLSEP